MRILSTNPHEPGIFAVGQLAVGVFALGQLSLGVVAIGQLARGVFAFGQAAIGVVAIGQGAIGLWHGTGMIALSGQSGYGIALHLLPRLVEEPAPLLPPVTSVADLLEGAAPWGWIPARIANGAAGPVARATEGDVPIDATAIRASLQEAIADGLDRAHVRVRLQSSGESTGYRAADHTLTFVADEAVAWSSRRKRHLAYGVPPKGKPGAAASTLTIVLRTTLWFVALGIVTFVTFAPLLQALR